MYCSIHLLAILYQSTIDDCSLHLTLGSMRNRLPAPHVCVVQSIVNLHICRCSAWNVLCDLLLVKRIPNYHGVAQIDILSTTKSISTFCIFASGYFILLFMGSGVENAFSHHIFRMEKEISTWNFPKPAADNQSKNATDQASVLAMGLNAMWEIVVACSAGHYIKWLLWYTCQDDQLIESKSKMTHSLCSSYQP